LGVKLPYQKLYVGSSGADTLDASGQAGAVAVFGQGGADVLVGGSGADLLVAQTGAQVRMTGGVGADVFRLQSAGTGSGGQNGVAAGRLEVTDFSFVDGDRLDLDALLQTMGNTTFVEDCVQFTRINNDAVVAFDLSGQKAFGNSAFTVQLDNIYTSSALADVTLRSLLYGTAMNSVLG
jgi:Ca2+-binding RTX toxin-like protein